MQRTPLIAAALLAAMASTSQARIQDKAPPGEARSAVAGTGLANIIVGNPEDAHIALESTTVDVRETSDAALVRMTVVLASKSHDIATARVNVYLPSGARIIGLAYDMGGEKFSATQTDAAEARAEFNNTVHPHNEEIDDPALLEWTGGSQGGLQSYRLSVFPMSALERTTATVTIAMPKFRQLFVDGGGRRQMLTGGTFAAPTPDEIGLAGAPAAVTKGQSLYAAPSEMPVALPEYRTTVQSSRSTLRDCYVHDGRRTRDLVVSLAIAPDGSVSSATVRGGSRQLQACVADTARQWSFADAPAAQTDDDGTQPTQDEASSSEDGTPHLARTVDYPIHFAR